MRRAEPYELDDCFSLPDPSLEACDEEMEDAPVHRECPPELLGEFASLMADHGHNVRSELMRGDPGYAMWQLARARATEDPTLRSLAAQLFMCLDGP